RPPPTSRRWRREPLDNRRLRPLRRRRRSTAETLPPPYDRGVSQLPGEPFDPSVGDPSADVPLLRELQRVLFSGTGPINWELARQIGIASASWGSDDAAPTGAGRETFAEAVRVAELAVGDLTGVSAPAAMATVHAVTRAQWVEA